MAGQDVENIVNALTAHPSFGECSTADLKHLAKHANESSVPAGWPLIHQMTPADACYVILDGSADVIVDGTVVATLGAGAIVGELGLVNHRLRNASVVSTSPLDLLHINADAFDALIDRRPAIRAALLARTA